MVPAGAGVPLGQVFGGSDSIAAELACDPVSIEDFLATEYWPIGIDSNKRSMAPAERPIHIVRGERVVL